jgi:hypothetical protein
MPTLSEAVLPFPSPFPSLVSSTLYGLWIVQEISPELHDLLDQRGSAGNHYVRLTELIVKPWTRKVTSVHRRANSAGLPIAIVNRPEAGGTRNFFLGITHINRHYER